MSTVTLRLSLAGARAVHDTITRSVQQAGPVTSRELQIVLDELERQLPPPRPIVRNRPLRADRYGP